MNRILQERCDFGDIKEEWQKSSVDISRMSDSDVSKWVRAENKKAKEEGSFLRYRSIADDSGAGW